VSALDGRVMNALLEAVDEVNRQLPRGRRLARSPQAVLLGDASPLDSLALVNFMVAAEEKVEREFGVTLSLVDDAELSPEGPYRTLATLAGHLQMLLEDARVA
jgi:hypothetical protein